MVLFVVGLVVMRTGISLAESFEESAAERRSCRWMFRLATFIQHDQALGAPFDAGQYPMKMESALKLQPPEDALAGITCHEIPAGDRKGKLQGLTFYLFDAKTKVGVLANGAVFRGAFHPDVLERFYSVKL
ncbi:MAG TPA: hypothetical protein VGE29_05135 [Prosthecobacter sp.]